MLKYVTHNSFLVKLCPNTFLDLDIFQRVSVPEGLQEWRVQRACLGRGGEQRGGANILTRISPEREGLCCHGEDAQFHHEREHVLHNRSAVRAGREGGEMETETERQTQR